MGLELKAKENPTDLTDSEKAVLLHCESYMFRSSGRRVIYKNKITKTFKNFLREKGLNILVEDIEKKNV